MEKKTWVIIGIIVAAFGALIGLTLASGNKLVPVNADDYNLAEVIPASAASGEMSENIVGNPDAPVKIFEYADYQCEGCAANNPQLNKLVEEYDGKVALVFRGYVISYHQNGTAAASAANAAALQGYWKEFKDLLFANQMDWFYSTANARQEQFERYFMEASDGKGDLAQFRKDMKSKTVAQKISFDRALSERVGLDWTPYIFVGDELIERSEMPNLVENLRKKIDAQLEKLEKK